MCGRFPDLNVALIFTELNKTFRSDSVQFEAAMSSVFLPTPSHWKGRCFEYTRCRVEWRGNVSWMSHLGRDTFFWRGVAILYRDYWGVGGPITQLTLFTIYSWAIFLCGGDSTLLWYQSIHGWRLCLFSLLWTGLKRDSGERTTMEVNITFLQIAVSLFCALCLTREIHSTEAKVPKD